MKWKKKTILGLYNIHVRSITHLGIYRIKVAKSITDS
jgi:hypothetical protein